MQTKIGQFQGVDIFYDSTKKEFSAQLRSEEHEDTVSAPNQAELEGIIARYKKKVNMPIDAIRCQWLRAERVKITSALETGTPYSSGVDVWISYPQKPDYRNSSKFGREKIGLQSLFKATPENLIRAEVINNKYLAREALETEIKNLVTQFTDPITRKDLGFEEAT